MDLGREVIVFFVDGGDRGGDMLHGEAHWGFAIEGELTGEHFKEEDGKRVNIGMVVDILATLGLFWAHISGRANHLIASDIGITFSDFGDTEIGEESGLMFIEEDVSGFEIAVDNPFLMGLVEGGGDTTGDSEDIGEGQTGWGLGDTVDEGAAAHVTHNEIRQIFIDIEVINGDDGGMFEGGDDTGFGTETGTEVGCVQKFGWQDFNGNEAVEVGVIRLEDGGHPPFAKAAAKVVAAEFAWFFGSHWRYS